MPIPKPAPQEEKENFIARFMGDEEMVEEFPDAAQRRAVAESEWEKMMSKVNIQANMSALVREDTLDGSEVYVCPAVLITEGVHNGVYYPPEELAKSAPAWNGVPVRVYHPQKGGEPVSANAPDLEGTHVGKIFNAAWDADAKKLRGEVWIRKNRTTSDILTALESGQVMEVSTGLFLDGDGNPGVWGDEPFEQTVVNYRPDHFALLPTEVGACSVEDGAGLLRVNSMVRKAVEVLRRAVRAGSVQANELSHYQVDEALRNAVSEAEGGTEILWITDVYDDWFVYEMRDEEGKETYYKRTYSVSDSDAVTIGAERTEVERRIEYAEVEPNAQEEPEMNEKVKALIANERSPFSEDDAELLGNMDEAKIDSLTEAYAEPTEEPKADAEPKADPEPAAAGDEEIEAAANQVAGIDGMHPEVREALLDRVNSLKAEKAELVEKIAANSEFSADELTSRPVADLRRLAVLVDAASAKARPAANFALNGSSQPVDNANDMNENVAPRVFETGAA